MKTCVQAFGHISSDNKSNSWHEIKLDCVVKCVKKRCRCVFLLLFILNLLFSQIAKKTDIGLCGILHACFQLCAVQQHINDVRCFKTALTMCLCGKECNPFTAARTLYDVSKISRSSCACAHSHAQCGATCMNGALSPVFHFTEWFSLALEKKRKEKRRGLKGKKQSSTIVTVWREVVAWRRKETTLTPKRVVLF